VRALVGFILILQMMSALSTLCRGNVPGFKQEVKICSEMERHLERNTKNTQINIRQLTFNFSFKYICFRNGRIRCNFWQSVF